MHRDEIEFETVLVMMLVDGEVKTQNLRWHKGIALRTEPDVGAPATGAVILGDHRPGAFQTFKISRANDYSMSRLKAIYPSLHRTADTEQIYQFGDLNEFFHFRLTWHPV